MSSGLIVSFGLFQLCQRSAGVLNWDCRCSPSSYYRAVTVRTISGLSFWRNLFLELEQYSCAVTLIFVVFYFYPFLSLPGRCVAVLFCRPAARVRSLSTLFFACPSAALSQKTQYRSVPFPHKKQCLNLVYGCRPRSGRFLAGFDSLLRRFDEHLKMPGRNLALFKIFEIF